MGAGLALVVPIRGMVAETVELGRGLVPVVALAAIPVRVVMGVLTGLLARVAVVVGARTTISAVVLNMQTSRVAAVLDYLGKVPAVLEGYRDQLPREAAGVVAGLPPQIQRLALQEQARVAATLEALAVILARTRVAHTLALAAQSASSGPEQLANSHPQMSVRRKE